MSLFVIFFISLVLTYGIKLAAPKLHLIDTPNIRSSHGVPTPRGGGIAFVITFFTVLSLFSSQIDPKLLSALYLGIPIALLGLIDDIYSLQAKVRLGVQILCAIIAVLILTKTDSLAMWSISSIGFAIATVISIVWLTNLYNFLDGMDGYAAAQAIFVSLSAYLLFHHTPMLWLAAAVGGFIIFNWHKASIFMGDTGSTTLGFIFGIYMVYDIQTDYFIDWIILLSLFWFDATLTLLRRWNNKESLTQAHKKHMYQRLYQSGYSHTQVVILGMVLNALLLLGLYLIPLQYHLYNLLFALLLLYSYLKFIDAKKGFK